MHNYFNFTSDDIALWCVNQEITLPLSAIPGGLFADIVIDLTTIPGLEPDGFCCDFSTTTHCLTVIECNTPVCEADAPELLPADGDCDGYLTADPPVPGTDADGSMDETPFVWPPDPAGTENTTPPYITEYIVTDAATGNIIGVFPTLAAAEAAANMEITTDADGNDTACIQAINHDATELDAVVAAIDTEVAALGIPGGLCGIVGPPCPNYGTLENLFAAASPLIPAPGITVAGVELLLTGDLSGLGFPIMVPVPDFCYQLSACYCPTCRSYF